MVAYNRAYIHSLTHHTGSIMSNTTTVAIVQHGPVYLNKAATLQKAEALLAEAAKQAQLVVFGETWLSGYPAWLDHCPNAALWNHEPTKAVFALHHTSGIAVPGPETAMLCKWAKALGVCVVMGVNEVVNSGPGHGTIYNSLITINNQGNLVNHHRKLMPTYTEKLVYGHGDGAGLQAVDTPAGKLGGLICWEHWMPHSRMAMHMQAEQIHVAVWPTVHDMHQVACRNYAFEGRTFVIGAGQMLKANELPQQLELPAHFKENPEQWVLKGGSCVVGPDGRYILEPVYDKEAILYASIDTTLTTKEKMSLDVTGHYNRPDVFDFSVNGNRPK